MKKFGVLFLSVSILLSGCTFGQKKVQDDKYTFPSEHEMQEMENNLLNDPQIIEQDKLLKVGDLGLEKEIKQVQNPPNENDKKMMAQMETQNTEPKYKLMHHSWKYPQLHPTYVNPKVTAINGSYINNVIGKAWDYYGTPYEYGSDRNNPTTFDCSDFTRWVHLWTTGMDLPKTSQSQWEYVKKFSKRKYTDLSQAQRGDMLFFMSYKGWQPQDYNGINVKSQPVSHVGIYLGNGLMIHTASAKTGGVRFDKVKGSHLEYRFIGGGQVIQ